MQHAFAFDVKGHELKIQEIQQDLSRGAYSDLTAFEYMRTAANRATRDLKAAQEEIDKLRAELRSLRGLNRKAVRIATDLEDENSRLRSGYAGVQEMAVAS